MGDEELCVYIYIYESCTRVSVCFILYFILTSSLVSYNNHHIIIDLNRGGSFIFFFLLCFSFYYYYFIICIYDFSRVHTHIHQTHQQPHIIYVCLLLYIYYYVYVEHFCTDAAQNEGALPLFLFNIY